MSVEEWMALWAEWYELERQKAEVNAKLIECKTKLRRAGVSFPSRPSEEDVVGAES